MTGRRRDRILAAFASVAAASALVYGSVELLRERQLSQLTEEVAGQSRALADGRWTRPVLRGEAQDGNAAEAAMDALAELGTLTGDVRDLSKDDLVAVARERRPALDRLRDSTQRAWAWTDHEAAGERDRNPDAQGHPVLSEAAMLLQGLAVTSDAGDCLRIATDMVRLGQDHVAGGAPPQLGVGATVIREGALTAAIGGCAPRASLLELRDAARELRFLATHEPPVATSLAIGAVQAARRAAELFPSHARDRGWLAWNDEADSVEVFLHEVPAWKDVGSLASPEGLRRLDALTATPKTGGTAAQVVADFDLAPHYARAYVRAQSTLRISALVLAARVVEAETGLMPDELPDWARASELVDPYTGEPMHWTVDGNSLHIWSVGENRLDDAGDMASDDAFIRVDVTYVP